MRSKSDFFSIFSNFLEGPGPPKIDPKSLKSSKKRLKLDVPKKHTFEHRFLSIFYEFQEVLASQNRVEIDAFCYFFENVDLLKNLDFTKEKQ